MRPGESDVDGGSRSWLLPVPLAALIVAVPALAAWPDGLTLTVSILALLTPWGALAWVRAALRPGRLRTWLTPALFVAPLVLTSGLWLLPWGLGLESSAWGLGVLAAMGIAGFGVLIVGPWLVVFCAWDAWVRRGGTVLRWSSTARLMAAVAAVAVGLTVVVSPAVTLLIVVNLAFGWFVAFMIREAEATKPPTRRDVFAPDPGYVPRADDDPFA